MSHRLSEISQVSSESQQRDSFGGDPARSNRVATGGDKDSSEDYFSITLDKQSDQGQRYGLAYRCTSQGALFVTGIVRSSMLHDWNQNCEKVNTVCAGDQILDVNGRGEGKAMVEELRQSPVVTIKFMKTGPRWHTGGIVEECIGKIDMALAKGLKVEKNKSNKSPGKTSALLATPPAIDKVQFGIICSIILVPNVIFLAFCSDMGYGIDMYSAVAPSRFNTLGSAMIVAAAVLLIGLYVGDWSLWTKRWQQLTATFIVVYLFAFGWMFKARLYPFAPLIVILFHLPVALGAVRVSALHVVDRTSFYKACGAALIACSVLLIICWVCWIVIHGWDGENLWVVSTRDRLASESEAIYKATKITVAGSERSLVYEWDCRPASKSNFDFKVQYDQLVATSYELTQVEKLERARKCADVKTMWFLVWLVPFIASLVNLILGAFCLLNCALSGRSDSSNLEKVLKQFVAGVVSMVLLIWLATSISGVSMRLTSTIIAFCGAGLILMIIWFNVEIDGQVIAGALTKSRTLSQIVLFLTSDWARAMLVIAFNMLIPAFFLVDMLNQAVRKFRGGSRSSGCFTGSAAKLFRDLKHWSWVSILIKANLLVMAYWVFAIGVAKMTYVFLSALNSALVQLSLGVVTVLFFLIGFTMFMLPPVPGIPVYILSGIIFAVQGKEGDLGYVGGIGLAVLISLLLKLCACCGQYMIGFYLGKSVKVQQLCQVDKLLMKAVERILKTPGLSRPKVAVLVGGPDWPTSVLCGILRLRLPQILLGTLPVIVVQLPCVLAGAFMVGPHKSSDAADTDESIWEAVTNLALEISAVFQLSSGILAMYYTQGCMEKHKDELDVHRPEHEPIERLTQQEQEYWEVYQEVTDLSSLALFKVVSLVCSTIMLLISMFMFMFMDEYCFYPFSVNSKISDPIDEGGLDNNALNLVLPPGWVAHGIFFVGLLLHFAFTTMANRATQRQLRSRSATAAADGAASAPDIGSVLAL